MVCEAVPNLGSAQFPAEVIKQENVENDVKFDHNFDEFTKIKRRKQFRQFSEVMKSLHEAMKYKLIISKNKFAAFIEGIVEDDLDDPEFVTQKKIKAENSIGKRMENNAECR